MLGPDTGRQLARDPLNDTDLSRRGTGSSRFSFLSMSLAVALVLLHVDEVHRRAADEAGNELVDRPLVEILGRADLLQDAEVHDGDAVAHRHCLDLVVGHVDDRGAKALVQARDLGSRLHAELGIEVGQRLVHQEHGRLAHDRAAQGDALSLAA